MKTIPSKSTKKIKTDQVIKDKTITKVIATILIILSGLILYLDKIFVFYDITLDNLHGWKTTEVYVWTLAQTISPIIIMLAMYLRPYYYALFVPVICYTLQFYFVMFSSLTVDYYMTWVYVAATAIAVLFIMKALKERLLKIDEIRNTQIEIMKEIIKNQS